MCFRETVNFSKLLIVMCNTMNRLLKITAMNFQNEKSSEKSTRKIPPETVGFLLSSLQAFICHL